MAKTAEKKTTAIVPADHAKALRKVNPMLEQVKAFVIRNQDDFEKLGELMVKADEFLDGETVKDFTDQAQRLATAHKQAVKWRDALVKPAQEVKRLAGDKRVEYMDKIAREAERKRAEEAERLHEKQVEEAKKEAAKIRRSDPAAAKAIVQMAEEAPPPELPAFELEAGAGFATRTDYQFEITDRDAIPVKYYVLDESLIRKDVNAFGMNANIPGVRVWEKKKQYTV